MDTTRPRSRSSSITARASSTPSGPSNAPALGTVSMCEKSTSVGASVSAAVRTPRMLPMSSVRVWRPACIIHESSRACAPCVARERNRRVVSPGTSVMRESSRQRAMTRAARVADVVDIAYARTTVASIVPCGSSVGTKMWLGLSRPKRVMSTSRLCLLGISMCTSSMMSVCPSAASAMA